MLTVHYRLAATALTFLLPFSNNFSCVGKGKNYEIYQHLYRVNLALEALVY